MLRVLTYHRIADPRAASWLSPALISASPAAFEEQVRYLAGNYRVVSIEEVLKAYVCKRSLPQRAVLITFDDAYRDFGDTAWPILRHYKLPATLFVPTGYPGDRNRSFWWDRIYQSLTDLPPKVISVPGLGDLPLSTEGQRKEAVRRVQRFVKSLPHAEAMSVTESICKEAPATSPPPRSIHTWSELRALAEDGVTLGSHTRSHPLLTRLQSAQIREEVRGSLHDLRREIGQAPPVFCYPGGAYNDAATQILKDEGIILAFTVLDGQNDLTTTNPLRLRRTNITLRTSAQVFRFRLQHWVSCLDRLRHAVTHPHLFRYIRT